MTSESLNFLKENDTIKYFIVKSLPVNLQTTLLAFYMLDKELAAIGLKASDDIAAMSRSAWWHNTIKNKKIPGESKILNQLAIEEELLETLKANGYFIMKDKFKNATELLEKYILPLNNAHHRILERILGKNLAFEHFYTYSILAFIRSVPFYLKHNWHFTADIDSIILELLSIANKSFTKLAQKDKISKILYISNKHFLTVYKKASVESIIRGEASYNPGIFHLKLTTKLIF